MTPRLGQAAVEHVVHRLNNRSRQLVYLVVAVMHQQSLQKPVHGGGRSRTYLHHTALHRTRPCNAIHRGHRSGNTAFSHQLAPRESTSRMPSRLRLFPFPLGFGWPSFALRPLYDADVRVASYSLNVISRPSDSSLRTIAIILATTLSATVELWNCSLFHLRQDSSSPALPQYTRKRRPTVTPATFTFNRQDGQQSETDGMQ